MNIDFTTQDIIILIGSAGVGIWYFMKKHWVANNLFGLAFAINGIELLHLNKIITGCILLGGLFFYDIFWVFGTNVMVTVAKSFEAPIKLVFPQDLLENGLAAQVRAFLTFGDSASESYVFMTQCLVGCKTSQVQYYFLLFLIQ